MLAPPQVDDWSRRRIFGQLALSWIVLLLAYALLAWMTLLASPAQGTGRPASTDAEGVAAAAAVLLEGASALVEPAGPVDPELAPASLLVPEVPEDARAHLAPRPEPSSAFADAEHVASLGQSPRELTAVPILMYHHVNDLPRAVVDAYLRDLTVPVAEFRRQLQFLEAGGASAVGLAELTGYMQGGEPLPRRPVILTFDDGYDDNYHQAYPLLREHGMRGTFFVVAGLVGKPGYMTWEQLREMQLNGMEIESHSLDHVDLSQLPRPELQRQLVESRRMLEQNLLRPVRYLNYPSGRYSPLVISMARAAGYEAAVTVNYGLVQQRATPYELNRVRVKGADTVESLASKMVPTFWKYPPGGRFGP